MSEKQFNPVVEFDSVDSWRGYIEANIAELTEAWRDETLGKLALPIGELLVAANFYAAAAEAHKQAVREAKEIERLTQARERAVRDESIAVFTNAPQFITATMKSIYKSAKWLRENMDQAVVVGEEISPISGTKEFQEHRAIIHNCAGEIRAACRDMVKASGKEPRAKATKTRGSANAGLQNYQAMLSFFTLMKRDNEIRVHTPTICAKNNGGNIVGSERNYGVLDLDTVDAQGDAAQGLVKHIKAMREQYRNAAAEHRIWKTAKRSSQPIPESVVGMEFLSVAKAISAGKVENAIYIFEIDNETGQVNRIFAQAISA